MKVFKQLVLTAAITATATAHADTLDILRFHHNEVTKHDQLALQALTNNLIIMQHNCDLAPTDETCEELDRAAIAHKFYKDAMQARHDSRQLAIEATQRAVEIMTALEHTNENEVEL